MTLEKVQLGFPTKIILDNSKRSLYIKGVYVFEALTTHFKMGLELVRLLPRLKVLGVKGRLEWPRLARSILKVLVV